MANPIVQVIIKAKDEVAAGLDASKAKVASWSSGISNLIAGAVSGAAFGAFFKRAADEVTSAERAVTQLSTTLGNVGVDFSKVKPQIDAAIASLQKVAAVDDDDAIAGLNRLVQVSGDYEKSLKNLPLVADVAAAKNIDLAEAAGMVGKVMAGTGGKALKDFGITTKDAGEAIEQLRTKVKGAAEVELQTLGGSLKAANIAYGDVAQSVGEVIAQSPGFQQFAKDGIEGLRGMAEWLTTHKTMLNGWLATLFQGVKESWSLLNTLVDVAVNAAVAASAAGTAIATMFDRSAEGRAKNAQANIELRSALSTIVDDLNTDLGAAWDRVTHAADNATSTQVSGLKLSEAQLRRNKEAHDNLAASQKSAADAAAAAAKDKATTEQDRAIDTRITQAVKAADATGGYELALAQLRLTEHATTESLRNNNLEYGRRLVLLDRLKTVHEAREKLKDPELRKSPLEAMADAAGKQPGIGDDINANGVNAEARKTAGEVKFDPKTVPAADAGVVNALGEAWEHLGETITGLAEGPLAAFDEQMGHAIGNMVMGGKLGGEAFSQAMRKAIASVALMEAKQFGARAIAGLAKGFGGNPAGFAEAAQWTAASVAMYAVASIAGGGGGSSPAAAGGGGSSASSNETKLGVGEGKLTVQWPGTKRSILDASNPDDQDAIMAMLKKLAGNRDIDIVFTG